MISSRPRSLSAAARGCLAVVAGGVLLMAGLSTAFAFHESVAVGTLPAATRVAEALPVAEVLADAEAHLVVSEVMTGGAGASDEFIEIYNPGPAALPLEGLELIYVTASGGTITRKAAWAAGAPSAAPGAHTLIANSAGTFAGIADVTYANGLASTGGSVALRILGASAAIDAAGWGNATNAWLEGLPATAAAAGHSLERLPGGSQGSGQDTDQNSVDFVERSAPDPQNSASPPIAVATPEPTPTIGTTPSPVTSGTPDPTPVSTSSPTPAATATALPTPSPVAMTIAQARALPDGSDVTVEGISLSDSAFTEGGGYLADASDGIAVLLADGSFPRGQQVRVTGTVDDRFSQRTVRADASGVQVIGPSTEPGAQASTTGGVGETLEGELVEVTGVIAGAPTTLTSGIALDLDDGSGSARVMVANTTGIDTAGWVRGANLQLRGVVGQRDSTGSGTEGYRVQPRDPTDILGFEPPATPTPIPTSSASGSASPSPSGNPSLISIAAARQAPFNARVAVRGIVTLPANMAEDGTAAIQDSSGAILLRLSDESGSLELGELVEISGTRSTRTGMETIRITQPPGRLGHQAQPDPRRRATGGLGEADEAVLVVVRGAVATSPRRTSAENIYFDVDDGSGQIRVFVSPNSAASAEGITIGSWVEVTGVLGQETTGRLPDRGYRIWPRVAGDVKVVATSSPGGVQGAGGSLPGGDGHDPISPGGGRPGGAAAGPRPGASAAAQQGVPMLAPLTASSSPAIAVPAPISAARTSPEPPPVGGTAGLLGLGGLLLTGAGGLVLPPGRLAELLRAMRHRFGPGSGEEVDREAEMDADDPAAVRRPAATPDAMPALVPLTVLDGASGGGAEGAPRTPVRVASVYSRRPER